MTARTWVYGLLTSDEAIADLVDGRVYAKKSMTSSVADHPYIVYQLGNSTDAALSEDTPVETQFMLAYVHDYADEKTADYMKIDDVIDAIKAAFHNQGSPTDGVVRAEFVETSQDLNDDTLNTVFRYVRFQLVTKEIQ